MKQQLLQKLHQTAPYTDQELLWLLEHIGDPDPQIRDELVYMTFGYGLEHCRITPQQLLMLVDKILTSELLTSSLPQQGETTLTRSFTALFLALTLGADDREHSQYHRLLPDAIREKLFQLAITYPCLETDTTGFHPKWGWVHAIAHSAEFLLAASGHSAFPKEYLDKTWQTLVTLLKAQTSVFTAGEAERLATIPIQLVLNQILSETLLTTWITALDFPDHTPQEYFARCNLQTFLSQIYIHLDRSNALSQQLKTALLSQL